MVQHWGQRELYSRQPYYQIERLPADPTSRHNMVHTDRYSSDLVNRPHILAQERNSFDATENGRLPDSHDLRRRQPPMVS